MNQILGGAPKLDCYPDEYLRSLWSVTESFIVNGTRLKPIQQLTQSNSISQERGQICQGATSYCQLTVRSQYSTLY